MALESFAIQIGCILLVLSLMIIYGRESASGYDRRAEMRFACSIIIVAASSMAYCSLEHDAGADASMAVLTASSVAASLTGVLWLSVIGKHADEGIMGSTFARAAIVALPAIVGAAFIIDSPGSGAETALSAVSLIPYVLITVESLITAFRTRSDWWRCDCISAAVVAMPAIACLVLLPIAHDSRLCTIAATMVLLCMYLLDSHREMTVDHLTGLYNSDAIEYYIRRSLASGKKVAIALFQIGGNDVVNNTYGHIEGDRVLIDTARCLRRASIGRNVFVGRYRNGKYYILTTEGTDILRDVCNDVPPLIEEMTSDRPYELEPLAGIVEIESYESLADISRMAKQNLLYNHMRERA